MSKQHNFDEFFESAMRQDPGYGLPKSFLQGVNDRIARKLAFRIQLKMLGRTAIVLALLTVAVFVGNYVVNAFFPKYAEFTISGYVVRAARTVGVPAPNHEFVVEAIHALEGKSAFPAKEQR